MAGDTLDRIDWRIVTELEADGRQSFADLGKRVGLSKTPCWGRVRRLQDHGVVRGFSAQIDPGALGLAVQCLAEVRLRLDAHAAFEAAVLEHPAIVECHTTAGDNDYLLRFYARSVDHLDKLLRDDLSKLPGVHRISTVICLKTIKSSASLAGWAASSKAA